MSDLPDDVTDEPQLELDGLNPYIFRSKGVLSPNMDGEIYDSKLFPINSRVELTEGKFPLVDYKDRYSFSKKTHVIGGKTVRIIGSNNDCHKPNNGCIITVIEHKDGGRRSRRSRRRRSRHARSRSKRY